MHSVIQSLKRLLAQRSLDPRVNSNFAARAVAQAVRSRAPVALAVIGCSTMLSAVGHAQSTRPQSGQTVVSTPTVTAVQDRGWGTPILDPRVLVAFAHRARFDSTFPGFIDAPRFVAEGTMPVVVRFVSPPSPALLDELAQLDGLRWNRDRRPTLSGAYLAHVTEPAALALAARPEVGRVQCDLFPRGPLPLDESQTETRADAARRAILLRDGVELDGRGVVIGDIDTSVHLFHPAFFHGDGGYFAWRDANGNGTFEPGVDGVDLNSDGMFQADEKLLQLSATTFDARLSRTMAGTTFRPSYDYLYVDTNGNNRRDFAVDFTEDTPAYGEPIFVADDVNGNGTLDVGERLIRLKTSKFRAINSDRDYLRGDAVNPLVQYADNNDMEAFSRNLHATGVNGILVGGVPGVSRLLGLAPRAEIVLSDYYGLGMNRDDGLVAAMQWVIEHGANVLVTEFAPYAGVTLDGSSEGEQQLDSFSAMGGVPVSPAGNLAIGHKHIHSTFSAGMNTISLTTDNAFATASFLQISLHHRARGRRVVFVLTVPGAAPMELPENAPRGFSLPMGLTGVVTKSTTMRGTEEMFLSVFSRSPLPQGPWGFALNVMGAGGLEADLYAGDNVNSWAGGFAFAGNDETRTICYPSTSDNTISVAAYTLHAGAAFAASSMQGQLARYSSRGPRIDGDPGIDIAAPDNPLSPVSMMTTRIGPAAYMPFGGTSGAGPHVAAAAALLRQINPMAAPGAIRTMLLTHTRNDMFAPVSAMSTTGHGKLDIEAALGLTPVTGTAPTVALRAPARMAPMGSARLDLTVTDDGPPAALRMRWDTDYDGTPDTDWLPVAPYVIRAPAAGPYFAVRVEVRDSQGFRVAASAEIAVVPESQLTDADRMFDPARNPITPMPMPGGCQCRTSVLGAWPARTSPFGDGRVLTLTAMCLLFVSRRNRRTQ